MKKKYIPILIFFGLVVGYGVYYQKRSFSRLDKYGRYTIATIKKIEPSAGRGCSYTVYVSYFYKGIVEEQWYCTTFKLDKYFIGKRLFYKFVPNYIGTAAYSINYDCLVPDSIRNAPPEGWSVEWMKAHFPDCMDASR